MRERSELARKGIARGRSVVALTYAGGVLFVAENPSRSLYKISELYDRVGFAAAGRFNEFDNLRRGGIQWADTKGYAYDRRDVTGRQLAYVYAQTLGAIFTEQAKPYEVELCVAEVAHFGETKPPELYRITYDGSINDEPHFVVMGGTTEPITTALNASYAENASLNEAAKIAVDALKAGGGNGSEARTLGPSTLEVAILDAKRPRRAFRRITGSALEALLPEEDSGSKSKKSADERRLTRLCALRRARVSSRNPHCRGERSVSRHSANVGARLQCRDGGSGHSGGAEPGQAVDLAPGLGESVLPALGGRAGEHRAVLSARAPNPTSSTAAVMWGWCRSRWPTPAWRTVPRCSHLPGDERATLFGRRDRPSRGGVPQPRHQPARRGGRGQDGVRSSVPLGPHELPAAGRPSHLYVNPALAPSNRDEQY